MSKHTPGPWLIDGRVIRSKFGGQICMFSTWISQTANETDENARLIAAAPDLLAALQDVDALWMHHSIAHGDGKISPLHEKVIAAIAKATGEQP